MLYLKLINLTFFNPDTVIGPIRFKNQNIFQIIKVFIWNERHYLTKNKYTNYNKL